MVLGSRVSPRGRVVLTSRTLSRVGRLARRLDEKLAEAQAEEARKKAEKEKEPDKSISEEEESTASDKDGKRKKSCQPVVPKP